MINPAQQQLEPFQWVMSWIDLMPAHHLIALLEAEFFPAWFQVLANWLSSSAPNFDEISRWYMGWKALFPEELLSHGDRINAQFNHALEVMDWHVNRILSGGAGPPPPVFQPPPSQPQPQPSGLREEPKAGVGSREPTLKEVVQRFAEENDLLFMPTTRRHEGKQVYGFGKVPVVVDKELIFAPPPVGDGHGDSAAGKWVPVGFDELLRRALSA